VPGGRAAQELRAREQLVAPRAEPVAACLRLASGHRLDRACRDCPVRGSSVKRAVSTPVPAPALSDHPGYLKARVREQIPPGQLFRAWPTVTHGLAHEVRLRSLGPGAHRRQNLPSQRELTLNAAAATNGSNHAASVATSFDRHRRADLHQRPSSTYLFLVCNQEITDWPRTWTLASSFCVMELTT
jgi:hypothetical protein